MSVSREHVLEVALISVIAAANKQGIDVNGLLDHANELVNRLPMAAGDREKWIADANLEISNAHAAVLTGVRESRGKE